jgi:hypothetical protein
MLNLNLNNNILISLQYRYVSKCKPAAQTFEQGEQPFAHLFTADESCHHTNAAAIGVELTILSFNGMVFTSLSNGYQPATVPEAGDSTCYSILK